MEGIFVGGTSTLVGAASARARRWGEREFVSWLKGGGESLAYGVATIKLALDPVKAKLSSPPPLVSVVVARAKSVVCVAAFFFPSSGYRHRCCRCCCLERSRAGEKRTRTSWLIIIQ